MKKKTMNLTLLSMIFAYICSYSLDAKCSSKIFIVSLTDSTGKIVNKKKEGAWVYYRGKMVYRISYFSKGIPVGITSIFHPNGVIWRQIPYENGNVSGNVSFYNSTGDIVAIYLYKHDLYLNSVVRKSDKESPPLHDPAYYPLDDY